MFGIVSTHFRIPHRSTRAQLALMDTLAQTGELRRSREFNERDDRNVLRPRVPFELFGYIAVAVKIQHDKIGLLSQGVGERRIRMGFGDAQPCIGEMLDVRCVGQAVVDEQHGRRRTSCWGQDCGPFVAKNATHGTRVVPTFGFGGLWKRSP